MNHKKLALQVHQERVLKVLVENKGRFIAVSDIAEQLHISLATTLDALVGLKMANLASHTVGGWTA